MKPQIIYSRYEYYIGDTPHDEVFKEYMGMFNNEFDRQVQVSGVSAAINCDQKTAILLVYDEESDDFLRLKFYGRKDVQFRNCRSKVKVENE